MSQNNGSNGTVQLAFGVGLILLSADVFAYLDPSTGSMVISVIVGIFASIALALKTYWYKFKKWFRRPDKQTSNLPKDPPSEA